MVESWLIRRVVEHASDEDLARFEAEFAALIEEYGDYDPEFYDRAWEVRVSLFRLAGNDFVTQLATDLRSRLRTFPRVLRVDPDHFAVYREHHSGVLAACVARDADRAALLIEEYMTRNGKRLAALLRADLQSASSDAEQRGSLHGPEIVPESAHQLNPERHPVRVRPEGDRDRRMPGDVEERGAAGDQVAELVLPPPHGEVLGAALRGRDRRAWGEHQVDMGEGVFHN